MFFRELTQLCSHSIFYDQISVFRKVCLFDVYIVGLRLKRSDVNLYNAIHIAVKLGGYSLENSACLSICG